MPQLQPTGWGGSIMGGRCLQETRTLLAGAAATAPL